MIEDKGDQPETSLGYEPNTAAALPVPSDVCAVLDQRLAAFAVDGDRGRLMTHALADLRQRL